MNENTPNIYVRFPVRLVFVIDLLLTSISFIFSYFLCSLILPDLWSHAMLVQLPIIVALTSVIFLFIGVYRGYVKCDKVREVYSIFNAICITNILTIILIVVNGKLFMEEELMVPLSIIVVHSILSFTAMVASRYLYKYLTGIKHHVLEPKHRLLFIGRRGMDVTVKRAIVSCLQEKNQQSTILSTTNFGEFLNQKSKKSRILPYVNGFYVDGDLSNEAQTFNDLMIAISKFKRPIYKVNTPVKSAGDTSKSNYTFNRIVWQSSNDFKGIDKILAKQGSRMNNSIKAEAGDVFST